MGAAVGVGRVFAAVGVFGLFLGGFVMLFCADRRQDGKIDFLWGVGGIGGDACKIIGWL